MQLRELLIILIAPVVAVALSGCASTTDFLTTKFIFPAENVRPANYSVTRQTAHLTTVDDVQLVADIYSPDTLVKTPTILVRIPFSSTLGNKLRSSLIARYWAGRGYTVVLQGTRGRYKSSGTFYPLMSERQDGIATLKWIAQQPWYDGRLAMWGGSAFGYTQWVVADQAAPGANAFFIQIASTNFQQMFYPGNAFSLESAVYWAIRSRGNEDRDVPPADLDRGINHLPIITSDDVAIGDTDFFNDWVLNTRQSAYWQAIDGINRAETIQAPALLMAGWFDPFLPSQLEDFKTITTKATPAVASETRLIIGPWGHATAIKLPNSEIEIPYRAESVTPSLPWFDYQLGVTNAPLKMPKVKLFVMGENRWREESEWPLARTQYISFYLHSYGKSNTLNGDGFLSSQKNSPQRDYDSYLYDAANAVPTAGGAILGDRSGTVPQNSIEERNDVLVYTTPTLLKPLEVTGPVKAVFYVTTSAKSTDFTAKLVDVYPNGTAYNLSDGILRQTYSVSDQDNPVKIEIELWPTSNVFFAGHKIRLEVSSSNFPRYDRNPNTGEFIPTAIQMSIARQRVFHSEEYPSHLVLPIIKEQPDSSIESYFAK